MGLQVHLGSFLDLGVTGLAAVLILCALAGKLASALGVVAAASIGWPSALA
jgi:hypothetical protein